MPKMRILPEVGRRVPVSMPTVVDLPALPEAGGRLAREALAALLTLADLDTPVWLRPGLADEADLAFLRFHCGCPVTDDPALAASRIHADDGMSTGIIYRQSFPVYQPAGSGRADPGQFDREFAI